MATLLHVDHNTLTIASAQYSNSGTYICRSEITVTTIGTRFSTASVSVIVQGKVTFGDKVIKGCSLSEAHSITIGTKLQVRHCVEVMIRPIFLSNHRMALATQ